LNLSSLEGFLLPHGIIIMLFVHFFFVIFKKSSTFAAKINTKQNVE